MFILHTSNKTENLLAHLSKLLETSPPESPFSKEIFLIQSQGMERWLSQQLASRFGVWGNYRFLFPGKFFSSMAQRVGAGSGNEDYERERLLWRIEGLLRRLDGAEFVPLRDYLTGESSGLKRFQLARQLAQLFDQYQIMRPEMLAAWQRGEASAGHPAENWQMSLWRMITGCLGESHRGSLWLEAIGRLDSSPEGGFADELPERLLIFGLNTLPPLFLQFLQSLARHMQVHLFLLNPCRIYWADLESKRQRARRNPVQEGNHEDVYEIGHPLLAVLGQQGREFQEMLLEGESFEVESFEDEYGSELTNLQQLQSDILNNRMETKKLAIDGTLSVHACHSRMREVEVVKDQLLDILEQEPNLSLRDIVVMAPEIQVYAPFISAVFADIQHAIADLSLRASSGRLDVFIRFLRLSQSRLGWQTVLELLEQPSVYPGFGLSPTDLETIRHWVEETRIRWGRSGDHKKELGLPALEANTWQAGLERMLMGYAVEDGRDYIDGVLPYAEIEGTSAQALGGLSDFMSLVFYAADELKRSAPLRQWARRLYGLADRLFASEVGEPAGGMALTELFSELSDSLAPIHDEPVELEVIITWLEGAVAERKSPSGFLRGKLTFCSMLPMRSIPFQVIVLLGMNEGEFPKVDSRATFDLMGEKFCRGDRSRRADDRYQFLEILLSTRSRLIMTFIGRTVSQNEALPPSVVIEELLEVMKGGYGIDDLVTVHPLQPFSRRYFSGSPPLFSYSRMDFETAAALSSPESKPDSVWWQGAVELSSLETVELSDLLAFFHHPQRFFVERQLNVRLAGAERAAEEREPFRLEGLDEYRISQDWIAERLDGRSVSADKLRAAGIWPSGAAGEILFDRKSGEMEAFVDTIRGKSMGEKLPDATVDFRVGGFRLLGKLTNLYRRGGLFYRYADLKGRDFMRVWLHHLVANRIGPQDTCLICRDADLRLAPDAARPEALPELLEIYRRGLEEPSDFFVEPAFEYVRQALKMAGSNRVRSDPLDKAGGRLKIQLESGFEAEMRLLFRNVEDPAALLGERFESYCRDLLLPAWEAVDGH